jgi:hypothetical protein
MLMQNTDSNEVGVDLVFDSPTEISLPQLSVCKSFSQAVVKN